MADIPIRDVREITRIPGLGGFLEVRAPFAILEESEISKNRWKEPVRELTSGFPPDGDKIEVDKWTLWHEGVNVRIPQSGGRGSPARRRVASDFRFWAIIQFDASYIKPGAPAPNNRVGAFIPGPDIGPKTQPFPEQFFLGSVAAHYVVGIRFQLGDPSFYSVPQAQTIARVFGTVDPGCYYYCDSVMVDDIQPITPTGAEPDVIRAIVRGSGSAPLRRYAGTTWIGSGLFGLDEV